MKLRGQHANNLRSKRPAVSHHLSKHSGIAAIAPLKIFVTQDGQSGHTWRWSSGLRSGRRWWGLRYSVSLREITTECDLGSHQPKEVRCDDCETDLFGRSVLPLKDVPVGRDAREVLKHVLRAFAQINEIGVGERKVADVTVAEVAAGDDESVGVLIRKRPQEHGICNTEDRRARADTQGNSQCCSQCKDRTFPQCSAGECQVS